MLRSMADMFSFSLPGAVGIVVDDGRGDTREDVGEEGHLVPFPVAPAFVQL